MSFQILNLQSLLLYIFFFNKTFEDLILKKILKPSFTSIQNVTYLFRDILKQFSHCAFNV
jgi:hypothetical protein